MVQREDHAAQGGRPETFWEQHGGFLVLMAVLLGILAWSHIAPSQPRQIDASIEPAPILTSLKGIASAIGSIALQIFFVVMIWRFFARFFAPILYVLGHMIFGLVLAYYLWKHGLV